MRKLPIPQDYEPGSSDEADELRVIAVDPAGSAEAALQALIGSDPDCAEGLASLGRAQPELAAVLRQLIDELDGLAYRHPSQGLLPLAGEPLWHNLPSVWPETGADGTPDLDTVAEWLAWFGDDAQHWWSGLIVVTNRSAWHFGDRQPVRTLLAGAAQCRIARQPKATDVTSLILGRLPAAKCQELRRAIAGIKAVSELEAPLVAEETRAMLRQIEAENQLEAETRPRLDPPPPSYRPRSPIAITHILHPETPADPDELTGEIESHNAYVRRLVLLEPIGDAGQALDACVPRGRARLLLDQVAMTAPELHTLALRIADHLDGLALAGETGDVPLAGIILHYAIGELLRDPKDDPWDRAATLYSGMWMSVGYSLIRVKIETPLGAWASCTPEPLRLVLASQSSCTIARLEEAIGIGHACLDWPISDELRARWRRHP
jgi:hypothetical protein